MDCRLATTTMRAGAIDELLSPPPPVPRAHHTQHTVLEGRRGGRIRAQASAGGRHKRVGAGGLRGRVGEGGLRGRAYHGRNLPRYLIACTRHAVHVPCCMHKARRACASLHAQGTPCMCLICTVEPSRACGSSSLVEVRSVVWPLRFTSRYCRVDTSCHSLSGHRSSVRAAWGAGGASSYNVLCAQP